MNYSVPLILFRYLMSLLIEGSAVMCVKLNYLLSRSELLLADSLHKKWKMHVGCRITQNDDK